MKRLLTTIFWPVLAPFEKDGDSAGYRPTHRKVLFGMGFLFLLLAGVSALVAQETGEPGGLVPLAVFFAVGAVCWIVGFLGSDAAVARIWGNR